MIKWILALALTGALAAPVCAEPETELPVTPKDVRPLLVGSQAPGGIWQDAAGNDFDLQAALDAQPTVFVFYRAHW